jgi:valyl-tRNA synthetase
VWAESQKYAGLRLNEYTEAARGFAWSELADWYLEAAKARLATPGDDREVVRAVLVHCFDQALRLLHPIVPFVTEALWQRLPIPGRASDAFVATATWPEHRTLDGNAEAFDVVREAVSAIRQLRSDYGITPGKGIQGFVRPSAGAARAVIASELSTIERLARCTLTVVEAAHEGAAAHQVLSDGTEVILPLAGMIDVEKECARLKGEVENLDKQLTGLRGRLANENFVSRAKPEVVEAERAKERDWTSRREQLATRITSLCGG